MQEKTLQSPLDSTEIKPVDPQYSLPKEGGLNFLNYFLYGKFWRFFQ